MKKVFALVLCMALALGLFAGLATGAEETGREVALDWQNGSFYTGAAPTVGSANRKFATINCNEGDVITFECPTGNWVLWAYAADENGYITGSGYLELKSTNKTALESISKTYTVAKIGDRVPTNLRLTVAPNFIDATTGERKDSNISDEMWAQFDLKISVVSNTGYTADGNFWLNGANYNGTVKAGTESTRRHLVLDCQKGDVLEILNNSSDLWGFWIYGIDANGAVNVNNGTGTWIEIKNQESYLFTVDEFAGKVPEKLLITTFRIQEQAGDSGITAAQWATFDASVTLYGHVTDASGNVWASGSKYDAADDNGPDLTGIQYKSRKYTEIACQEGKTLTFNFDTSKWNIYLYAAKGDNYVAGSGWKTLEDGFEYVVPTGVDTLRLTACPKPDGAIPKAYLATLDVKVTGAAADDDNKDDEGTSDWKYGTFYNGAAPGNFDKTNRKYTTIECKKGDKITFESPTGNWVLWAYAADENGFITGSDYLELKTVKDALEAISETYTVRTINGRVPTVLRLTVAPNFIDATTGKRADSNITDEMWAEFDIKITVTPGTGEEEEEEIKPDASGLIWNKGAFYDTPSPNTGLATTRRYTVMEVAAGDVIKFNIPTNDWNIWVYPADEVGSINYFQAKNGQEYEVKAINGRTPTTLRITAIHNPDSSISDALWKTFNVTITKTAATENPDTSDFSIVLPAVAMICSLTLVSGVVILRKKRKI